MPPPRKNDSQTTSSSPPAGRRESGADNANVILESFQSPIPLKIGIEQVPVALFRRHLGLPAGAGMSEPLAALEDQARAWFSQFGEPWYASKSLAIRRVDDRGILLEHEFRLNSSFLAEGLRDAEAVALVAVAITAGASVDQRIAELWQCDRPDEAMFLNAYAMSVVEHVRGQMAGGLRDLFHPQQMTVLPHYSPGYAGWELSDQQQLLRLFVDHPETRDIPLTVLPSGGLHPGKSTMAIFGITRRTNFANDLDQFWNCRSLPTTAAQAARHYGFPEKALKRWRDQRLRITAEPPHELLAAFRFDGTTCSNMGIPIRLEYTVRLGRDDHGGYQILSSECEPDEHIHGYRSMCAYLDKPAQFMSQLRAYRPLVGRPLREALTWQAPSSPAGCVCTRASQDHKWKIVLQTIHYALETHE